MTDNRPNKSELFTAYNKMRAAARRAGDTKQIERLNKALGILQSKAYYRGERESYHPNVSACGCKDWEFHFARRRQYTGPCKHMLAESLVHEVSFLRASHNVTSWIRPFSVNVAR